MLCHPVILCPQSPVTCAGEGTAKWRLVWRLEAQAGPPFHFVLASFPVVSWTRVDNLNDRFRDLAR